ncbi:hypothetical protein C8J56DRAFT_1159971 [Mycena floridula]|nr:hypothetical protein C8J56DRAFT_1159971 [Mycena floridula]
MGLMASSKSYRAFEGHETKDMHSLQVYLLLCHWPTKWFDFSIWISEGKSESFLSTARLSGPLAATFLYIPSISASPQLPSSSNSISTSFYSVSRTLHDDVVIGTVSAVPLNTTAKQIMVAGVVSGILGFASMLAAFMFFIILSRRYRGSRDREAYQGTRPSPRIRPAEDSFTPIVFRSRSQQTGRSVSRQTNRSSQSWKRLSLELPSMDLNEAPSTSLSTGDAPSLPAGDALIHADVAPMPEEVSFRRAAPSESFTIRTWATDIISDPPPAYQKSKEDIHVKDHKVPVYESD